LVIEVDPRQVGRQYVGGELHPLEAAADRFRKRAEQHGFPGPRYVFEQYVAGAQEAHKHVEYLVFLANDHF
jgi:hypothetical protein